MLTWDDVVGVRSGIGRQMNVLAQPRQARDGPRASTKDVANIN
jgi:hypothetical protein